MSRDEHRRRVLRIKEHIAAGDIYQANLSQRFELPFGAGGLRLYDHLRARQPRALRRLPARRRAGDRLRLARAPSRWWTASGPGRGPSPARGRAPPIPDADRALAAELILSPKERAEHLMLVDLARNDLGKVAAIGSVAVDELMTVEDYSHVRHIVSNVTARLLPGRDALDALLALFPGGTITGVPKIRCMEILDEVEPAPRGFYTGALFYATPSGRLDANILIRSAVVAGGRGHLPDGRRDRGGLRSRRGVRGDPAQGGGLRLALEAAGVGDRVRAWGHTHRGVMRMPATCPSR